MSTRQPRWLPRNGSLGATVALCFSVGLLTLTQMLWIASGRSDGFHWTLLTLSALLLAYAVASVIAFRRHPEWRRSDRSGSSVPDAHER